MKKTSGIISALFWLGGLGIIIASFFLFLEECQAKDLFYLNMILACLIYSVVLYRAYDIFKPVDTAAESSSGYGLKWYGLWIYAPIAAILIVASIIFEFGFKYCLIGHLVLMFVLLMFFFLGSLVVNNVGQVINTIEKRKSGLKEISTKIDYLEMVNRTTGGNKYQNLIDDLRENVRYITASEDAIAISLEEKLIEKISLIASQIENSSQSCEVVNSELQECLSVVEMRKKHN